MNIRILLLLLFTNIIAAYGVDKRKTIDEYINEYAEMAVKEMKRSGVPASITLAQGILESDCGNSDLATEANNHFGIKCHKGWTGEGKYKDDDTKNECFRVYNSAVESYADHSDFLKTRPRYAGLFQLEITDYKGWAKGLKEAGYATNPNYPTLLINLIERNGLNKYDDPNVVIAKSEKNTTNTKSTSKSDKRHHSNGKIDDFVIDPYARHEIKYNNRTKYIVLNDDDTYESIAKEFGLQEWEILKFNDLDKDEDIKQFRILYVQPKCNKANRKFTTHTVKQGETLHYISQVYGVKMSKLMKYNNLTKNNSPQPGKVIKLKNIKA